MEVHILEDRTTHEHVRVFYAKEDLVAAYVARIKEDYWGKDFHPTTVADLTKNEPDEYNPKNFVHEDTKTEMLRALTGLPFDASRINMKKYLQVYCPDMSYYCRKVEAGNYERSIVKRQKTMECSVTAEDLNRLLFQAKSGRWKLLCGVCDCGTGYPPPLPTCNWKCRISAAYHKVRARINDLPHDFPSPRAVTTFLRLVNRSGKWELNCAMCLERPSFYRPCTCPLGLCQTCARMITNQTACFRCKQPIDASVSAFIEMQQV